MAAGKATDGGGLDRLKAALKAGEPENVYIFYGEEAYLREHYLGMLRKLIVPGGMEDFNLHRLDGRSAAVQNIADAAEALPMMSEKTLVVVTDMDVYKLNETQRNQLIALLGDFPPYCCLVFVYDTVAYKPDGKMKKLKDALAKRACAVEFRAQGQSDLVNWVSRHFAERGKTIDRAAAEHLIFTCGTLMTGLLPEIEKISSYSTGKKITTEDINAVADPIVEADVYAMTNAISRGDYDGAAETLGKLLKKQEEPIRLLSLIGAEMRKLYTARIAIENGRDRGWLVDVWGMRSDYPAKLLMQSARSVTKKWCRDGVALCRKADLAMKSTGADSGDILKLLLMQLAQGARER
jgi:DNA polymerase-3 subunit delta